MYKEKYNTVIKTIDYENKTVTFLGGASRSYTDDEESSLTIQVQDQIVALAAGEELSVTVGSI